MFPKLILVDTGPNATKMKLDNLILQNDLSLPMSDVMLSICNVYVSTHKNFFGLEPNAYVQIK